MFVCICRAVTDRTIKGAISSGARSVEEVGRACGAGTGCGGCRDAVQDLITRAGHAGSVQPLRESQHEGPRRGHQPAQ